MRRRPLVSVLAATLVAGCAYYNGLYNANRLASDARRAEREGRTGEARSLWSQAAIKAESVVVRFPNSKYHDDVLLLQGTALFNVSACTQAVRPLGAAVETSPDSTIRTEARLLLARCRLAMLEPDSARLVLAPLVEAADSATRAEARYLRGRAALAIREDSAALADLASSTYPDAVFPRAIALTRLGARDRAVEELTAAARPGGRYAEDSWLPVLDSVGTGAPAAGSAVADAVLAGFSLGPGQRARLLLGDGERWLAGGEVERAAERFDAAHRAAADSLEGRVALAHLMVAEVGSARDPDRIAGLHDTLRAATERGGTPARIAGRHVSVLGRARLALGRDGTDLTLFVAAEDVRDSLAAPALAASLFELVAERHPESVIAPKALLAAAALQPDEAARLVATASERFPTSVYILVLRGAAGDRYRAVEDSLRHLLEEEGRIGETERRPGGERRVRPGENERRRGGGMDR